MRRAIVLVVLAGCDVGHETTSLRVDPEQLDLVVELGATRPEPLYVTAQGLDVTDAVTFSLAGAPLGQVDAHGFQSDGRTGGRAMITIAFADERVTVPVRVVLHVARGDAAEAPALFAAATAQSADAQLEPGDGAALPPNLATLDVNFAAPAGDDLHEVAVLAPELDFHIVGRGGRGDAVTRTVSLTPAEWDAITRTVRGSHFDLITRTLASSDPATMRVASSHLTLADLELSPEILFTGKRPADPVAQVWSYSLARGTTAPWMAGEAGACLGCHLAISRDGKRIAAGGDRVIDVASRAAMAPPSAANGNWQSAAFGPDGALVTASSGVLRLRDGRTAMPLRDLPTEIPAAQPAVGSARIAYVGGPIDPVRTQPIQEELRVASWDPMTQTLGPGRVLAAKEPGVVYKLPDLSPDERWIVYTRAPDQFRVMGDVMMTLADGTIPSLTLASGFDQARFASSLEAALAGGLETEPIVWIVMKSNHAVGGRDQTASPQLWAMVFYPERGIATRPFHLPGQDPTIGVLHAPAPLVAVP